MRAPPLVATVVAITACADAAGPPRAVAPVVTSVTVAANPHNVLSAVVSVKLTNADSVAVRFRLANVASAPESVTPAVETLSDSVAIPVLGMLADKRYVLNAIAYWSDGKVISGDFEFTTGSLPGDLPQYIASGPDPSPGFIVFAAGVYGIVIDNLGRVVWYRRFPYGPGLNFMVQPDGHYAARPSTPDPGDMETWIELDPLGNITRTLGCANGLVPRPHDLISKPEGDYWLLCDETRTMDLSSYGGFSNAVVTGTAVQHLDAAGKLLFQWSPFEHFAITDGSPDDRKGTTVNWTHGNGLEFDLDGNLLVSFRNLSEITKIDVATGAVIWRMGGRRNEFTFQNSTSPAFSGQHSVRVSSTGELTILDNTGTPGESRAEHYTIDAASRTARLTHYYSPSPHVVTLIGGSVQRLNGGRTLVSFGTAGRVVEYDADGVVKWTIDGNPGYVFRAQRILSLYAPGVGTAR